MSLLTTSLHALFAPLLLTVAPANDSPLTSGWISERGCAEPGGMHQGAPRKPEPNFTDCRGPIAHTFGTVYQATRCAGPEIVVSGDSEAEALECALASAARGRVQLAASGSAQSYAICVTGPFDRATHQVMAYSVSDAEACARSQVCGALGNCTSAPQACR